MERRQKKKKWKLFAIVGRAAKSQQSNSNVFIYKTDCHKSFVRYDKYCRIHSGENLFGVYRKTKANELAAAHIKANS